MNNLTKEVLFIGAGTKGAKKISNDYQPFLIFNDKPCIEIILSNVLQAESINEVYIWGDKARLKSILGGIEKTKIKDIYIIEERNNIIESFFFSFLYSLWKDDPQFLPFFHAWNSFDDIDWELVKTYTIEHKYYDKQVNVITSDTPFLSGWEIDQMVRNKRRASDIVIGRTDKESITNILGRLQEPLDPYKSVKNYYSYFLQNQEVELIVNNFVAGKPLVISKNVWQLVQKFYENRTIVSGKKINFEKLFQNIYYFKKLILGKSNKQKYLDKFKSATFLVRSYLSIVKRLPSKKKHNDLELISRKIYQLTGLKVDYLITPAFGSAFDIDTSYELGYAQRNFEEIFREHELSSIRARRNAL